MPRPPVIGLTIHLADPRLDYVERGLREPLQRQGAVTIVLPRFTPIDQVDPVLDLLDGLQISGGADVDPSYYGEEQHELTESIEPEIDAFEIALTRGALDRGMPVLGLCRGSQVLAVADGGRLTQDVPTQHDGAHVHGHNWVALAHEPPGEHWHEVVATPGSGVERWLAGGPSRVNTFHHQCVAEPGSRLQITARTLDGVVEATERNDGRGWAAGLQWHNELQWQHDERFMGPFVDFVEAARRYAAKRH
ncbi:MAG: gamma-glutamyl-gamma-aminobutyrate hydrolase family protein [Gaiellales bacterium]